MWSGKIRDVSIQAVVTYALVLKGTKGCSTALRAGTARAYSCKVYVVRSCTDKLYKSIIHDSMTYSKYISYTQNLRVMVVISASDRSH